MSGPTITKQALRWVEEIDDAVHSDWRLPNIKEVQSIVDVTRSPDTTQPVAIDAIFNQKGIDLAGSKALHYFTLRVAGRSNAKTRRIVNRAWFMSSLGEREGPGMQRSSGGCTPPLGGRCWF